MTEPRFITAAEVEGGVIPRGGSTNQVLSKRSSADFDLKWATGGAGGGLAEWDSGTEYSEGTIVLDRDGTWQATGTNTNSQPISGNTDWTLVGGTPYVDVLLAPEQIVTAPFYDTNHTGPGVVAIPAPGENLIVYIPVVVATVSAGDNWSDQTNLQVNWTNTAGEPLGFSNINDGTDDGVTYITLTDASPHPSGTATGIINAPVVIHTENIPTLGTRSVNFRIYYRIESATSDFPSAQYFVIEGVDQGSKTFTIIGDHRDISDSISVVGSTGNDGVYTVVSDTPDPPSSPRIITAVDPGSPSITIDGDHTDEFAAGGGNCVIQGSPANDGNYAYNIAIFDSGQTIIGMGASVLDGTPGGTILALAPDTFVVVSEAIPDPTFDGWIKQ